MEKSEISYVFIVIFHILIGIAFFYVPFFSKIYGFGILLGGIYFVVNSQNKNNEVLYAAAYIVGSEVLLRMTNGSPSYESSKYGVIVFMLLGFYYKGISKNALAYWIFILLLIPGVFIATQQLNYDTDIRKRILFNISGPLCLAISSLYCYNRKITFKQINMILLFVGSPIISTMIYLLLYTPSVRDVITGTASNSETSGGFGPNQVATILGLGMFVFVSRLMYASRTKVLFFINLILVLNISYRGLVTFSRGGMITGFLMILILVAITYFKINYGGRIKMNFLIIGIVLAMLGTWIYSSNQTGGLIEKRYANQDATGREKEDQFTGRGEIAEEELNIFLDYPIFGAGVGKSTEIRQAQTGELVLSHSEITRMLSEHGSIGILALLILFVTPIILYIDNEFNIYLLCFVTFWILTINHAAMRIAAPAFIYSLSLLKVVLNEK